MSPVARRLARDIQQVQVLRQDLFTVTDQQREVDDIFQLAGISRPGVGFERVLRSLADQRHSAL